jgi:hypothetical protein
MCSGAIGRGSEVTGGAGAGSVSAGGTAAADGRNAAQGARVAGAQRRRTATETGDNPVSTPSRAMLLVGRLVFPAFHFAFISSISGPDSLSTDSGFLLVRIRVQFRVFIAKNAMQKVKV